MVQGDPHPIAKYRVIGPLSNLPEFQKAFSCKPDARWSARPDCGAKSGEAVSSVGAGVARRRRNAEQGETRAYLVTGANRGIGLAFARHLSGRGDRVIATARQPEKARDLARLPVRVEQLDVADERSIADLAGRLEGEPLDVLINNAGIGDAGGEIRAPFDEGSRGDSSASTPSDRPRSRRPCCRIFAPGSAAPSSISRAAWDPSPKTTAEAGSPTAPRRRR